MAGPDTTDRPEFVHFNGVKYRRMGGKRCYYLSQYTTNRERRTKAEGLHRAVYEFYSGEKIPKGFHVHHKDGDPFNNDHQNLECLSAKEHATKTRRDMEKMCANLDRIRDLTKAWHSSPAGKAWHSANGKRSWLKRKPYDLRCDFCATAFQSVFSDAKFCSDSCASKSRYRNGNRHKEKQCVVCGALFRTSNRATQSCSRQCRSEVRRNTMLRVAWVDRACEGCDKHLRVRKRDRKRYCSQSCAARGRWARARLQSSHT